ncbi:MAG: ComF family protein [Bradymonadales bacterium]|nr:ComF family protein [Bradymonadales bacterium]
MILDHLLFASLCPACDLPARGFCQDCQQQVHPWTGGGCCRCGARWPAECFCACLPSGVQQVHTLWQYEGAVADLIEYTKYRGELWRILAVRSQIVEWLACRRASLPDRVEVVPIPPSRSRLRQRGFDLPLMLARWFAGQRGVVLRHRALRRVGEGPRQAALNRQHRLEQVSGAFVARRPGRLVVLLDDVITTGATISACSSALWAAGAERIWVLAVARTPLEPD